MQTIIDKLSNKPEGRSLLKWLTAGLGLLTGYQMTGGFWGAILPAIATALVKRLEQTASNAARAKLEPGNGRLESLGFCGTCHECALECTCDNDKPDFSQIWKQSEAPTEKLPVQIERKDMFQQLGIAPMPAIPHPLINCQKCGEFRGHGHECKQERFPTPQEIEETEKLLEPPPPTEFFVHWYDADDGAKVRKFTDKFSAIMFRNTKPGAVLK